MSTLLVVQAHPHVENSLSLTVGKQFIKTYRASHPDDKVIIRDLYAGEGVPQLNDVTKLTAKYSAAELQVVANFLNDLYRQEQKF